MKPRVLHVFKRFMHGGAEEVFRAVARGLADRYEFHAVAAKPNAHAYDLAPWTTARVLEAKAYGPAVGQAAEDLDAALVHCTVLPWKDRQALKAATRRPVIDSFYNAENWRRDGAGHYGDERLDAAVACDPTTQALADVPMRLIVCLPDLTRFRYAAAERAPTIVLVARWGVEKNIPRFVRVARAVHERFPAARFIWVGGPAQDEADAVSKMDLAGSDGHIAVTGATTRPQAWLAGADLFLLTSDVEGGPFAVVEALAAGVPVVSTAVGLEPRWEAEGQAVRTAADEAALVEAVLGFCAAFPVKDDERRRDVADRCKGWSADRMVAEYGALYDSLLAPPLVSILMPAWNAARFVGEAIASCRAQAYARWELLVVDDGSTDGTFDAAVRAAAGDARIRVERRPHQGYARTFNEALALATGDLVARLDADDRMDPAKLAWQVAHLQAYPETDIVSTAMVDLSEDGAKSRPAKVHGMIPQKYVDGGIPGGPCNGSLMAWRRVYDEIGPFNPEYEWSADGDWNLRALAAGVRYGHVPRPLYVYRHHPQQMTKRDHARQRGTFLGRVAAMRPALAARGLVR